VKILVIALTLFLLSTNVFSLSAWEDVTGLISDMDVKTIAVNPHYSNIVYAGTSNRLYRSVDRGEYWEDVFSVYGDGRLEFITIDKCDSNIVYIATSNGLFKTVDAGDKWRRVFKGIGEEEKGVLSVAVHSFDSNLVYAGTKKGMFSSKDGGRNWHKLSPGFGDAKVRFISPSDTHSDVIYVATSKGVFKTGDLGSHWRRVYVAKEEEVEEGDDEEVGTSGISCIAISSKDPNEIYLGRDSGVLKSSDAGENWHRMPLGVTGINYIKVMKEEPFTVYAATGSGVFKHYEKTKTWQKLHTGFTATKAYAIALNRKEECLWAATDRGIFKMSVERGVSLESDKAKVDVHEEPTIREIQEAAIQYAEVAPKKIKTWRRGAKFRALLPELNLDYDKTINYDSGADKYYVGPYDWGFTLKWDLADLVWSPYQKDIDVRSRLMVQLRDDILDEVTHLYYERKRLKAKLMSEPKRTTSEKHDEKFHLEELTASIDALTGGYLSRRLSSSN